MTLFALALALHIDFPRLFPPVETQRQEYQQALKAIEAHRGHVTSAAMNDYSRALEKFERLDAYLYLRYATDTRNIELLHEEEEISAAFEQRTAFLRKEPPQDEVVSRLNPLVTGWPDELYDALNARKETSRDLYAFALLGLVRARTEVARLRGFPDAASEVYAGAGLTRADSQRLLTAVAAESARYVAFREQRGAAVAPPDPPKYSFDEARALLQHALAPLGPKYLQELDQLLDPANGRIDIRPGEHRKRGGFSKGFPGMTSVLYMSGYTGSYSDVRVVAHEGTHAVQRAMQARSGVSPLYASAPKFVMEALAIVAELVLPEYLYRHEADPARRQFFLDQLLTSKGLSVIFETAAEADLEERIYDGVSRGEIHTAEDLDRLTVSTFARYGIDAQPERWTKIRLLLEDPFYDINYTWAAVIALPLFAEALADPAAFAPRYERALASGFNMPSREWLHRFVGIDLNDPHLVKRALDAIQPYVSLSQMSALMREGEVPGVSIVAIHDRKIAWSRAVGVANRDTGEPLTDRSVFESASLTKPVFAYAVLALVDGGVLSLDVPLHKYLPEPVTDERMKLITARMVLSHTTGFQNEVMPGETLQVHFTPGSRFSYSGAGYLYLQRVVEHLTGKPLPELMRELVFGPLDMRSSGYVWTPEYEQLEVYGHNPAGVVATRRKPTVATVATLHTTPLDYARFVIAVMKRGSAMLTPQTSVDESCTNCLKPGSGRMSSTLSWGLGWALEQTPRGKAFWHWGENNAEFQNFVMGYGDGDGIVVFTNSGNGFSIMPQIVSSVLGGEHPAFAWMGYEGYRSPGKVLLRDVLARGAAKALESPVVATLTESQINAIGYNLLQRNRVSDAIALFTLNVERFKESFNAYDSLGEAYAAAGDRAKAIANYTRSLELNPKNTNAAEMVQKLRGSG